MTPSEPESTPPVSSEQEEVTIADVARTNSDARTIKARRFLPNDMKGLGIKAGVGLLVAALLAGIVYGVMLLMGGVRNDLITDTTLGPEATAPPNTILITTTPPVTTATTAAPEATTFFVTDPVTLTERWNTLAEVTAPSMVLFSDLTSPFIILLTPNITLEGALDPVTGNATMRATPTGTPEGDGAILSALGILMGTADPSLSGTDRKALLMQLGLDVDRPDLEGINGTLTYNGLAYRMVYQGDQNVLEFVITPAAVAAPVTTVAAN